MSNENNEGQRGWSPSLSTEGLMRHYLTNRSSSGITARARKRLPSVDDFLFPKERFAIGDLVMEERRKRGIPMPGINLSGMTTEDKSHENFLLKGFRLAEGMEIFRQSLSLDRDDILLMIGINKGQKLEKYRNQGDHYILHDIDGLVGKLVDAGFVRLANDVDWLTLLDEKNLPKALIEITASSVMKTPGTDEIPLGRFNFYVIDPEVSENLRKIFANHVKVKEVESAAVGVVDIITDVTKSGLEKRTVTLKAGEKTTHPSFYPWMNGMSAMDYIQEYLDAKEKILYLYGLPGTGKSSLLMTAIAELGLRALMTSNAKITSDPSFVSKLCEKLASDEGQYDLVIIEDGDALMRPRIGDDGSTNLALNELLSATDGIGAVNFKLAVTSNKEDTEGIDPALLRHGRAFDIMKFGRVTPMEAAAIREHMKLPPVNFVDDVTLAQVMAGSSQPSMRSAQDENVSIVGHRFPLNESQRGLKSPSL